MHFALKTGLPFVLCVIGFLVSACTLKDPIPHIPAIDPSTLSVFSPLSKRLQSHVNYLAGPELKGRKPGTEGNQRAAEFIIRHFTQAGLKLFPSLRTFRQSIDASIGDNLLGVRYSSSVRGQKRFILVGAHFDHLGEIKEEIYPGADDNASAVAILLELAYALPPLKNYSVVFAAFNAEEPPYFQTSQMGSYHFVKYLPEEIRTTKNIQVAIIMDLVGGVHWESLRNVVFSAGAEASPFLYQQMNETIQERKNEHGLEIKPIGLHLIEEIPVIGHRAFSDYDAFRRVSVPIVFLSAGRTPRYHQPSDTPRTLYYERMALTIRWLQALLSRIDGHTNPYSYQPHRVEVEDEIASFRPLILQAANWKTRIPGTSTSAIEKFQSDVEWLEALDPSAMDEGDIKRLERVSLRLQCLVAKLSLCSLF